MTRTDAPGRADAPIPVAEYVRMSSEHQQYSTQNQSAAIEAYASTHAMRVVRRYCDEGRSGVRLKGRPALQQLLRDVRSAQRDFAVVLVFDVSRWGRFQNADEAAYHEFVCHLSGVKVIYVAEPFADDGTPLSTVLKGLKRAMAGEYSRELSAKVYAGQKRLIRLGYRQGGMAGYGLRRMRLDATGAPLGLLSRGQQKGVATDRVILVPGPEAEVREVRGMFRDFVAGATPSAIARGLNKRGIANSVDTPWTAQHVRSLLGNAKYIGDNVYGKTCGTLHQVRIRVPEHEWVRATGAFSPLISTPVFKAAQRRLRLRQVRLTDEQMLVPLRAILLREGYISTRLIRTEPGARSIPALVRRFGGLRQIYRLIGFTPVKNLLYADARFFLRDVREATTAALVSGCTLRGVSTNRHGWQVTINGGVTVSVTVLRTSMYQRVERWYIRQIPEATDIILFVRMSADGTTVRDYVSWPRGLYGFIPKDMSPRACAAVGAYVSLSLASVVACLGGGMMFRTKTNPSLSDGHPAIRELTQRCRNHGQALSKALAIAQRWPGSAIARPPSGDQGPEFDEGDSFGNDVLRYIMLVRQARNELQNAALVCWLARYHRSALTTLQWGADDLPIVPSPSPSRELNEKNPL